MEAERGFQVDQRWHQFALGILPSPFGNRKLLDVGCGGGGVAAWASGMGWEVTGRIRLKALKGRAPDDEGYHFRDWVKEQLERKWEEAGLRLTAAASYGYLPFVDTLTLYKARSGKRRVFAIGKRWESMFADRFVWLLAKTS